MKNVVDITKKLKSKEGGTGYAVINLPVIIFYNQIGASRIQDMVKGNVDDVGKPIIRLEIDGPLHFMAPDEVVAKNMQQFLCDCKLKAEKIAEQTGEVVQFNGKKEE